MDERKIYLGCGPKQRQLPGYKNIDNNPQCEPDELYDFIEGIKEEDNSVDEILISHALMYFKKDQVLQILKECYRVLKPNKLIRITEDNKELKTRTGKLLEQYTYKGETGELFTRIEIADLLRLVGFVNITEVEPFHEEQLKYHLNLAETYPLARGRSTVYFLKAMKPKSKKKFVVYLFLDDFGEHNSNMDLLWRLRNYFDDFKVTVFAIPNHNLNPKWREYILSLGWIQLGLHGYHHTHFEELDDKTLNIMPNLGYSRVYRPPYLELTDKMKQTLEQIGYKIIMDHNWRIDQKPPLDKKPIVGYGHIYPYDYVNEKKHKGESLFLYWKSIMKLPKNTEFRFL